MTFECLRLTGPDEQPYQMGQPLDVYDGASHVGRLLSVRVSDDGHEVWLEDFLTTDIAMLRAKGIAQLVVAEVVHFIAQQNPAVHIVHMLLSRDIESLEIGPAQLANLRSRIFAGIGAGHVRVVPMPHARHMGHFAVSAVWQYNRESVEALQAVLLAERAAYAKRQADEAAEPEPERRGMLDRLLGRPPR